MEKQLSKFVELNLVLVWYRNVLCASYASSWNYA